ncbi:MAG: alpha/beta hydrolase [Acidobacteriota bacterium]
MRPFLNLPLSLVLIAPMGAFSAGADQPSAPTSQTFVYKTVGDCAIRADVYRPGSAGPFPVVLWIHGGALIMGDRRGISLGELNRYLEAGFIVASIDYRLAPETKLPLILEDVADAYHWVRLDGPRLFEADPERIAVVGHSAGGYLTLVAGYRFQPRPKALVSFYGYGDIVGDWYRRPDPFYLRQPAVTREEAMAVVGQDPVSQPEAGNRRGRFYLYCRQQGLWPREVVGMDPEKDLAQFNPFCPIRNITRDYPPTLLLHGDQDTDVPFQQSAEMSAELKRVGVQQEFVPIRGGEHGFDRKAEDPQTLHAFDRVIAFLKRVVAESSR